MVEHSSSAQHDDSATVVVLAYDGVAADEAGVIVEILTQSGIAVVVATIRSGPVTSFHGDVVTTATTDELGPCDALVIPGGMGVRSAAADPDVAAAVGRIGSASTWLCATSTGSLLLASSGLIEHARVTTHWLARGLVTDWGLTTVDEPFVEHGRVLTASGVGSSASVGFRLVGALAGVEAERQARSRYQPDVRPDGTSTRKWSLRRWLDQQTASGRRRHRAGAIAPDRYLRLADEVIDLDLDLDPTTDR